VIFVSSAPAWAQSGSVITQGFQTGEDTIAAAALVGLVPGKTDVVELSNTALASRLIGVVSTTKPLIALSDGSNEVQVITSGLASVLVSDMNGPVESGDRVMPSPIKGVGMKATESGAIVGTAQADLEGVSKHQRTISDKAGQERLVSIGIVPVQINVAFYTPESNVASFVPPFLQATADKISGRNVSPARVLVAGTMFLLLFVSISVLLYSAVRSSITSIGRNPLSEGAVRKGLGQVGITATGIVLFVVMAIYLVLTL
jgi:hypothetical protein